MNLTVLGLTIPDKLSMVPWPKWVVLIAGNILAAAP
jgi:hypothetical protein